MKSKQFIKNVSMLTLAGITVVGSSVSAFASTSSDSKVCVIPYKVCESQSTSTECTNNTSNNTNCTVNNKPTTNTGCTQNKPATKPGCTQNKPATKPGCTQNKPATKPGCTQSKPENNNSSNQGNGNLGNVDNNTSNDNITNDNITNDNITNDNTTNDTTTSTQKSFEDQVLELVNKERAANGLSALTMDENLRNVARVKSSDMSSKNYFSHTSPTYGSPFDMLKTFGISYKAAAENIAQGYTTPQAVVNGWMNSSGHRANILNASYTKIGIGYEANGNYWTQLFIG